MDYLRPLPPSFWSIRMYDGVTRYSVPNPNNRYSLGSDNDLKKNADRSFTLFLQADSPGPDKESNWFPAPKGPFYLLLRNYHPCPKSQKVCAILPPLWGRLRWCRFPRVFERIGREILLKQPTPKRRLLCGRRVRFRRPRWLQKVSLNSPRVRPVA